MNKDKWEIIKEQTNKDIEISPELLKAKKSRIEKAEALASLQQHYGWKILYEEFIKPRVSIDKFLRTNPDEDNLARLHAKMSVLNEMLDWITQEQRTGEYNETFLNRAKN